MPSNKEAEINDGSIGKKFIPQDQLLPTAESPRAAATENSRIFLSLQRSLFKSQPTIADLLREKKRADKR
jgi:hypothetical protein